MPTATKTKIESIERTDVTQDELEQYCAEQIEIDDALYARFFGELTVRQRMLIDRMGFIGQRLDTEKIRIQALKANQQAAGTAGDYAKAVDRDSAAEQKLNSAKQTYEPQIAEWERKIAEAKQVIGNAANEKNTAAEILGRMNRARHKLMTDLLPESFQSILKILTKPVRDQFKDRIRAATDRAAKYAWPPSTQDRCPDWSAEKRDESQAELERLKAEQAAAELEVGREFRELYIRGLE